MKGILTFHHLGEGAGPLGFAPAHFARLCDALVRRRIDVLPLARLVEAKDGPGIRVAFTFDDGLRSFATEALPILERHGFPASVFVVTARVGQDNAWPGQPAWAPVLSAMSWDELAQAMERGASIENHTRTHPDLRALAPDAVRDEIEGASEEIERRLGRRPLAFAYPFGHVSEAAARHCAAAGLLGVTTRMAWLGGEPRERLPRLEMCYLDGPRRAAAFGRLDSRAWLALRRAGRALRDRLLGGDRP